MLTMLKLEELRDMIMVLDMEDDAKTSALTALTAILESKDGADGKHQEKICRDTVRNLITPRSRIATKVNLDIVMKNTKLKEEQKIEEQFDDLMKRQVRKMLTLQR